MENILELINVGNLQYFKCYRNLTFTEDIKMNIIYYPSLLVLIFIIVIIIYVIIKNRLNEISDIYPKSICIQKRKIIRNNYPEIFNNSLINEYNEAEIEENFQTARNSNENHFMIYFIYLKNKIILFNICLCFRRNNDTFYPIWLRLILISLYLDIYYFITVLSYNETYVYEIKSFSKEFSYIIAKEWDRVIIVYVISIFIYNLILYIFFENKKAFNEANDNLENHKSNLNFYNRN